MADRNLNFDPTVTHVTPQMPNLGIEEGAANLADNIAQMSANSKALNATAQTALGFRQLDAQYREATAGNPNDPEALKDLQAKRATLVSQIGEQVPAIASREYMTHAIQLQESSDKLNEIWGMHQQMRNAGNDLKVAEDTQIKMANMAGIQFAQDGASMGNLNSVLNFEQAQKAIKDFVTPVIGAPKTDEYLKNFSSNWVKSFVAGVAEHNPQAAAAMLERPEIADHFTTQDRGDMADVIKKTQKQQALIKSLQTTKSDGGLTDIVNDPNMSYFDKRAMIDRMDAAGQVSSKAASAARRVIKSTEDADSQTDTPVMSDLVNKAYDLNANATTSADDYLTGVRNLHQQVLEAQADGKLTSHDAMKVTRQINQLTEKKLADATNTAGMEFYDANQTFNALPPEYRGQATRALFYASHGKDLTPQQLQYQATQIMQKINDQRRQRARDVVSSVQQSDTEFLKTIPNATPESITATAKKYGISEQEVILQLRAQAGSKARAAKSKVSRVTAGAGDEEDDSSSTAKPVEISRTPDTQIEDDMELAQ